MFEPDYIMRQIKLLTDSIGELVFHKRLNAIEMFDEDDNLSGSGLLYHRLKALVKQGKINEAENLLFETLHQSPIPEYFEVAIQFYTDLTALSDETLASANFSRDEIRQGLREIQSLLPSV